MTRHAGGKDVRMEIVDANKYGTLDPKRLQSFEASLKGSLPDDYREYLMANNGGEPVPGSFRFNHNASEVHGQFYGLHDGPAEYRLDSVLNVARGRIPSHLLPIAGDPFGNEVCIAIKGKVFGKVFFWDHELAGARALFEVRRATSEIASSFSDFLAGLFEYVPADESEAERILRTNDVAALRRLLETGLDVETRGVSDCTLLERAAITARMDIIKLLVEKGAKLNNALVYAEDNAQYFEKHKDIVKYLKEAYHIG